MSLEAFMKKYGKGKKVKMREEAHGKQSAPGDMDPDLHPHHGMGMHEGFEGETSEHVRDVLASKHGDPDHGHFMHDLDSDKHHTEDDDEIEHMLRGVKKHIAKEKDCY